MPEARTVSFPCAGADLFAVDSGQGVPLVFCHGGLADARAAAPIVAALAGRARVITPDLRGAGRSRWAGALGWDRLADDVVALLDHLGLDRALVGGTSMGSAVALRAALSHADRVLGLLLVSPVYAGADLGLTEAQARAMARMDEVGRRAPAEGVEVLFPLVDGLPPEIRERARAMMASFDPASVAATTRFLASGAQPIGSARELEGVRAPALIVAGTDPEHPAEVAELYARHLPRATLLAPDADLGDAVARLIRETAG